MMAFNYLLMITDHCDVGLMRACIWMYVLRIIDCEVLCMGMKVHLSERVGNESAN